MRFDGVRDRTHADSLRGRTFVVPVSWLPDLADDQYWPHELDGADVVTESGRSLGAIVDVIANPANDLWVARDQDGAETMIPAIRQVIVDVDVGAKRVIVRDVPGLTAPDDG